MTGTPSASPSAAPGLLLIAVDRLPAWILPPYGASWVAMPRLTGLAARGIVFDRAIATTDDPRPALADLLGGADDPPPLVAAAATLGWRAALVTDDASLVVPGAEVIRVEAARKGALEREAEATCLGRLGAAARGVVTAGDRRLVIVHVTSLGTCWDAPAGFREAYADPDDPPPPAGADVPDFKVGADADPDLLVGVRQAFAGQLTLLDEVLGDAIDAAEAGGWTVAVVGLRGLALGLHGHVGPGGTAPHGELVHVPAMIAASGRMAGQRYGGLVVPADIGATLRSLVGGAASPPDAATPWRGRCLADLLDTWAGSERDRVVAVTLGGVAVATPAWHCVHDGTRVALFAKPDDYFEMCDVADRCSAVAEELGRLAAAAAGGDAAVAWNAPLSHAAVVPA